MNVNFKYISKKIVAGLMASTMILSTSGCGKYSEIESGGYYLTAAYSFRELKTAKVYVQKNTAGASVVILRSAYLEDGYLCGYEILTDASYKTLQSDVIVNFNLQDYLLSKNLIDSSYSNDDFEKIYSMLKEEYIINEQINEAKINVKK